MTGQGHGIQKNVKFRNPQKLRSVKQNNENLGWKIIRKLNENSAAIFEPGHIYKNGRIPISLNSF